MTCARSSGSGWRRRATPTSTRYTTYPSNPAYPALPRNPLPSSASLPPDPSGKAIQTTPFFATGKPGASDYDSSVPNNNIRTIEIPMVPGQDSVWAYYGCFLDVYDVNNNCSYSGHPSLPRGADRL